MTTPCARPVVATVVAALVLFIGSISAATTEYKLGDVANDDIITPMALHVMNPEASDALKKQVAQQIPSIVRYLNPSASEAGAELRASVVAARTNFMTSLQQALLGRVPTAADFGSMAYTNTVRDVVRESAHNLPVAQLAPLWIRGASDEAFIASLIEPLVDVMAQPILEEMPESVLLADQPVRLIRVKSLAESPALRDLETVGENISIGKLISLTRAGRMVEMRFPAGSEETGRFVASFLRVNTYPAPGLTELLRSKRIDGVAVNRSYEAGQTIVKKGQAIDRAALDALGTLREKSLIGTLQSKLEDEQSASARITRQTKWLVGGLIGLALVIVIIIAGSRERPSSALVPVVTYSTLTGAQTGGLEGAADSSTWQSRAIVAEVKVERAHEAIRLGALAWMKEKIFQTLFHQRAELLSAQKKAEMAMRELEQRLEHLHIPLQERIAAYEKRIQELERDLATKAEENRELIGNRITVAKQQLEVERGQFGAN